MATMTDLREWAKGSDRGDGECQGFVANDMCAQFGRFRFGYGSALQAAHAPETALRPDYPGFPSFAYWIGTSGDLLRYGHVAFGTPDELFMASSRTTTKLNASGTVGSCSVDHYTNSGGVRFLGWSPVNGVNTMPRVTTAGGGSIPFPQSKGKTAMLYHLLGSTPTLYALAGTSPGTPANWLETTDQGLANAFSRQIGNAPSAGINDQTWKAWKAAYTAPLTTSGSTGAVGAPVDMAPVLAAIAEVPGRTRAEFTVSPLK